jgi:hypothetical protein
MQPVAVGDLQADTRRGLEMRKQRLVPTDTRLFLPAPVALDIMLTADTLRDKLTWSPSTRMLLERFRACMAVCFNYTFFCRVETCVRCLTGDLTVDRPSQQICIFIRKSKGDQRRDIRDKLVLAVTIPANPMLADLQYYYSEQRTTFSPLTTNVLPLPPSGAYHLKKEQPSGMPPQHIPHGWPSHSAR